MGNLDTIVNTYKGIRILHEDNHLIVAVKPTGLLSQADITGDADMLSLLKEYIKITRQKQGKVFLGLVHRLDRPVGGVMVFARTSKAASRLSEQIRERKFQKTYLAAVRGAPDPPNGTLRNYLAKDESRNTVYDVREGDERGSLAILEYETLKTLKDASLLKINLVTGKPHQIRAQLSIKGCAIIGDQKYGKNLSGQKAPLALWASSIMFRHPVKDKTMRFESEPPLCSPWTLFK